MPQAVTRQARFVAFVLVLAAAVAYVSNLELHVSSDATPHVLTAASWLRTGNADLDEYVGRATFSGRFIGPHFYSWYPPGTPLLAVPGLLALLALGLPPESPELLSAFGKVFGVLTASLSVGFVFLACRSIARPLPALLTAAAYAFGTSAWSNSSQNIWQHGPSQLFVALGTYLLVRASASPRAGLAYGIATLVRPTDTIVAAFGLLRSVRGPRELALRYLGWGLPALAFLLVYNALVFGSPFTQSYPAEPWTLSPLGHLGLLVSPSRGLFVYSPFLLLALLGFARAWRGVGGHAELLRDASLAIAGVWLLHGAFAFWWGGWTYGNRYLSDVLPLFALALVQVLDEGALRSRWSRVAFAAALAWSVLLQFAGAAYYYDLWDGRHWDVTPNIDETPERLWDWSDPQWWFVLRRMVLSPGTVLAPSLLGAAIAAALVGLALRVARSERPSVGRVADHEPVVLAL